MSKRANSRKMAGGVEVKGEMEEQGEKKAGFPPFSVRGRSAGSFSEQPLVIEPREKALS